MPGPRSAVLTGLLALAAAMLTAVPAPAAAAIVVDQAGTDFDTALTAVTGTRDALDVITCNTDSRYGLQSEIALRVSAGTTYHFMVNGYSSEGVTGTAVLNVHEGASND